MPDSANAQTLAQSESSTRKGWERDAGSAVGVRSGLIADTGLSKTTRIASRPPLTVLRLEKSDENERTRLLVVPRAQASADGALIVRKLVLGGKPARAEETKVSVEGSPTCQRESWREASNGLGGY